MPNFKNYGSRVTCDPDTLFLLETPNFIQFKSYSYTTKKTIFVTNSGNFTGISLMVQMLRCVECVRGHM